MDFIESNFASANAKVSFMNNASRHPDEGFYGISELKMQVATALQCVDVIASGREMYCEPSLVTEDYQIEKLLRKHDMPVGFDLKFCYDRENNNPFSTYLYKPNNKHLPVNLKEESRKSNDQNTIEEKF